MHNPAYRPNPTADARDCRLIRAFLWACLLAPLLAGCATTAQRHARAEHAQPACLTVNK